MATDFAPDARAPRGKGPRTRRALAKRRQDPVTVPDDEEREPKRHHRLERPQGAPAVREEGSSSRLPTTRAVPIAGPPALPLPAATSRKAMR